MKFGRIILQVRTQSDFLFDSHFHYDGGHDAVSRRKVLPSGECTCSAFPYRRVRQFLVWVHSRPTFVLISEHNFYIAVHIVQNVCLRLSVHLSAACNVELSVLIWVGLLRISKIVNGSCNCLMWSQLRCRFEFSECFLYLQWCTLPAGVVYRMLRVPSLSVCVWKILYLLWQTTTSSTTTSRCDSITTLSFVHLYALESVILVNFFTLIPPLIIWQWH